MKAAITIINTGQAVQCCLTANTYEAGSVSKIFNGSIFSINQKAL
jgi:hypothetical protein